MLGTTASTSAARNRSTRGRPLRLILGDGPVDIFKLGGDQLAFLPADEFEAVADQVHDAGLDLRLRKDSVDGLWEALEAIDHGDQYILDATVLQFGHDAQPELGTFGLFDPDAQYLLGAVGAHAQRQIHGLVLDAALVADLNAQRVEEDQWIGV